MIDRGSLEIVEDNIQDKNAAKIVCPMGSTPCVSYCSTSCAWFSSDVKSNRFHFYCKGNLMGYEAFKDFE